MICIIFLEVLEYKMKNNNRIQNYLNYLIIKSKILAINYFIWWFCYFTVKSKKFFNPHFDKAVGTKIKSQTNRWLPKNLSTEEKILIIYKIKEIIFWNDSQRKFSCSYITT